MGKVMIGDKINLVSQSATQSKLKILIIEDQTSDVTPQYMLFHHLGHKVSICFDGGAALDELSRETYDVIILDWNMPYIGGAEFLSSLESDRIAQLKGHKIIIHSGESITHEHFRGAQNYQILDIWQKPLSISEISYKFKQVSRYLKGA